MKHEVYIQGYEGSFHQAAAIKFLGKEIGVNPCATFNELIKKASVKNESTRAVMAIENCDCKQ